MTISTLTNRIVYIGNGSTTTFAFPYPYIVSTDIKVYVEGVLSVLNVGYTVSDTDLNPNNGANIIFTTAPANSTTIVILSDPDLYQNTDLPTGGAFLSSSVETMSDKLTLIVQRLSNRISRAVRLSDTDTSGSSTILTTPTAATLWGWDTGSPPSPKNYLPSEFAALISADLSQFNPIATFAALASTAATVGQVVTTRGYSTAGIGSRDYIAISQTHAATDNISVINSATAGIRWRLKDLENISDVCCGAIGDGATDDTTAIQRAITYCIANNNDLEITGLCRLTAAVNVDRAVDGAAFDAYFTMFSNTGGGFYVDTSINLFTSTIAYTTDPVCQLVRWKGLRFFASSSSLTAYIMHGPRFLRSEFVDCNFAKIRLMTSTNYCQSIYLINCQARRWAGVFMLCQDQSYDIQVIGGMYEGAGGAQAFFLQSPIGCKFFTQMEGITGTALEIPDAQGVDISCYFEANGLDIDMRTGNTFGYGVNIHGGYFANSTATYTVKWGVCSGCSSTGNWHTGSMHDLLSTSNVEINDFAQTSLSNLDAAANIGYRESTTLSVAIRGANSASYTVSAIVGKYCRNGKQTTVQFDCTLTSTATNAADQIFITSGMPTTPVSQMGGVLCGHVEVVGSATNNGISPLYCSDSALGRFISSINVIPANVATDAFTLRFYISYMNT